MRPLEPLRWTAAAAKRLEDAAARKTGAFLLEGFKAVEDALERPGVRVREVWLAEDLPRETADTIGRAAMRRDVRLGHASARDLVRVSDTVAPQGVLAWADDVAWSVDDLVSGAKGPLLLLDGVQDPGNVGAVIRVAAAFGASGLLVGEGTADPLGPKALRASAGTAVFVPFARGPVPALVESIARAGHPIWLLEPDGEPIWDVTARPRVVVLGVGSEGRGPSEALRRAAVRRVAIPISPAVESLNAAVAVGIVAAHVSRLPIGRPPPALPGPKRPSSPASRPGTHPGASGGARPRGAR